MLKPIRNSIQCKKCGEIISSFSTHDFKYCLCHSVAVDGGFEYMRVTGSPVDYTDLSIFEDKDGVIGTINEVNEFVPIDTLTLVKNNYEHLFLEFFKQYNATYDFNGSLDFAELQVGIENMSVITENEISIPVEKFISLFNEIFLTENDYYQPADIFLAFRNRIIYASK
jgi:hypothetical protein